MTPKNAKDNPGFDRKAPTGKNKRPDHPDFWDTSECKKNKLTGIRQNKMALQWEFWILGRIEKTVSFAQIVVDKDALTKTHIELFAMTPPSDFFKSS